MKNKKDLLKEIVSALIVGLLFGLLFILCLSGNPKGYYAQTETENADGTHYVYIEEE